MKSRKQIKDKISYYEMIIKEEKRKVKMGERPLHTAIFIMHIRKVIKEFQWVLRR